VATVSFRLLSAASASALLILTLLLPIGSAVSVASAQSADESASVLTKSKNPKGLAASPKKLGFGDLPPLKPSAPKTVTIHNPNATAINVNSIGSSNPEFVPSGECVGSLAADGDCAVSIVFTASSDGKKSAKLTITNSATGNPLSVKMTGEGKGTPEPSPTASATPTATATATRTATPTPTATATGGTPSATATATLTATPTATSTPGGSGSITGTVIGGTKPITGSSVTLYQMGASGYGKGAVSLGNATTDSKGAFTIKFTPPASPAQVYLVATGGNAGGGTNSAIVLMSPIGMSNALPTSVTVSEVTTVASVSVLQNFLDSTGQTIGTSATNAVGLNNSVMLLTSKNLIDITTGLTPATLPAGLVSPSDVINSLADMLAPCVETATGSTACNNLFTAAKPPGGSAPTTTILAALDIARNPGNNVAGLASLVPSVNPPFAPTDAFVPTSWVLALNYTAAGAAFYAPYDIALDAAGNVFASNDGNPSANNLSELTAASAYDTGFSYTVDANDNRLGRIAVDTGGNVWVAGYNTTKFEDENITQMVAASGYTAGVVKNILSVNDIAIDTAGNVFVLNGSFTVFADPSISIDELTASSSYGTVDVYELSFDPTGFWDYPTTIALDSAGDVFIANGDNGASGGWVSELEASGGYSAGVAYDPTKGSFGSPQRIAVDASSNAFTLNFIAGDVSELTAASGYTTISDYSPKPSNNNFGAPSGPESLLVDPAGNLWSTYSFSANDTRGSLAGILVEYTAASGYSAALAYGPAAAQLSDPSAAAVDQSGNVWMASQQSNENFNFGLSELIGIAAPTITPKEACLIYEKNNGKPCTP